MPFGQNYGFLYGYTLMLPGSIEQGSVYGAGPDTIFLGEDDAGTTEGLLVDRSQYASNIGDSGADAYPLLAADARFNLGSGERTYDFKFKLAGGDGQYLWYFDASNSLKCDGAGNIVLRKAGSNILTVALTAGGVVDSTYVVTWSVQANPDTTGGSDAYISRINVWNITDGTQDWGLARHSAWASLAGTHQFNLDGDGGGDPGSGWDLYKLRVSTTAHPPTEIYRLWVNPIDAPTTYGVPFRSFDPPTRSTIGEDGHFAGPQWLFGAKGVEEAHGRFVCPLINDAYAENQLVTHTGSRSSSNKSWLYYNGTYYLFLAYTGYAPFPPNMTHIHAWAYVWQHTEGTQENVHYRIHSRNRPTAEGKVDGSPDHYEDYSNGTIRNAEDAGRGAWIDLGTCKIAKDLYGCTYLSLSATVGNDNEDQQFQVKAFAIEPYLDDTEGEPDMGVGLDP